MLSADARWLGNGTGEAPQARWSFATEAELAALEIAREAGETLAGDQAGGLVLLNRLGEIISINRGFQPLGGAAIGQAFNGTTVPLYTGFVVMGLTSLAIVAITERGRLFQPS